jgi:hypothetical protein
MKRKDWLFAVCIILAGLMLSSCGEQQTTSEAPQGTTYTNETCKCSLTLPDNWSLKEYKPNELGPYVFMVQFFSDDFNSNVVFLAQSNSVNFKAEEAVDMDISNMKAAKDVVFVLLDKGPIDLKNYNAYQMTDKFTQRGITFYQKRIYLVTGKYLYGVVLNSKTEEAFEEDIKVFNEAVKTLVIKK